MNVAFFVIGSLLALGAVLAARPIARGPHAGPAGAGMGLLVIAGLSSAAVGLVPLDVDGELHALVATPVFVAQPVALVLLGLVVLLRQRRILGSVVLGCGLLASVGGIAFAVSLATGDVGGLYERIALWPCQVGVAALGWYVLRLGRHPVWETEA